MTAVLSSVRMCSLIMLPPRAFLTPLVRTVQTFLGDFSSALSARLIPACSVAPSITAGRAADQIGSEGGGVHTAVPSHPWRRNDNISPSFSRSLYFLARPSLLLSFLSVWDHLFLVPPPARSGFPSILRPCQWGEAGHLCLWIFICICPFLFFLSLSSIHFFKPVCLLFHHCSPVKSQQSAYSEV